MTQYDIKKSLKVGDYFWLEKGAYEYKHLKGVFIVENVTNRSLRFNCGSAINFMWDYVILYPLTNNLSKLIFLGE